MATFKNHEEDREVFRRLSSTGRISGVLRQRIIQNYNVCSLCSKQIEVGRPAFAGYDYKLAPQLVCGACAAYLEELATPVYWQTNLDISIDEGIPLWRYMDFAKYVSMLREEAVYFTRASNFDDIYEGAAGKSSRQKEWDEYYLQSYREIIAHPPTGPAPDENSIGPAAERLLDQTKRIFAEARNSLVSCWHQNSGESEALWKIYCPHGTSGLAVKTNVSKLWNSLVSAPELKVGKVQYLDYATHFAANEERIFCKRSTLSYENEVRAVVPNPERPPVDGSNVPVDLSELIESVIISPYSPPWFQDIVSETTRRYGKSFEIHASEIREPPFY
ncbi:hypothetical protein [Pseudoroseicyclus tamaricis]|uniref:DUF2971 domain-containing protein n=1 Tax=Pseudoroseicyclus tamaricis TaxID=2705421 RepID=A0A6B2JT14_9RHOB|nr:hypothetical protein [Pseudoroseicyclus tamaricis]NDV01378.1 hypothetical protein [Pseudoroseicyclus tamaricis]